MEIATLTQADTRNEILCEAFLVTGLETFEQLLAVHEYYSRKFPDRSVLVSLDDFAQASYTCTHAIMAHGLDDTDGHDLSQVDPAAFEDGEHPGFLSTPSEFFIRRDNFIAKSASVRFDDACDRGIGMNDEDLAELESVNATPGLILDDRAVMWAVPVDDPSLALCAFPNGYFTSDLNPFENHALAALLHRRFGYRLFGIGASWLGFRREAPLDSEHADQLAHALARLYSVEDDGAAIGKLREIAGRHAWLFLRYTE
ncbi:hypothetical protein [Pseudoduganella lutea]|uniref:DUF4253 domain-containing protein n=1 Tax=Pseudoduganella lutea TaxID=321985 RepID=A0A4P6KT58_9BURK|nr:hypothetical protein [Pseudoduganella lutea]QBE62301.1 hypothetical protein EWM63_04295 [Pseudoduganella lutea]